MSTRTTPPRAPLSVPDTLKPPRSGKKIAFQVAAYLVLILFALIYIFPFLIEIGSAFKTDVDANNNPLNPIPQTWTTAAFHKLADANFARWFTNSTIIALVVTAGRVFFDSLAGYALARLHFRGRAAINGAIIAVMAIPSVVLLIPKFLVLVQLHLTNSYPGMIIPLMADAAGVFIMRQFFINIPAEVEEAARIDGAGTFKVFWRVVLPMARPAVITLTILSFQGSWNEFSFFLVANNNPNLDTLTTGVATLIGGGEGASNQFPFKLAAALLMTIPTAVVFFVFQRYFIRGASSGAVKG
ncbi:multiple sugar transport system permease protein [Nakamurella panacisegetis]|uniref:Multiple sugar transport system permease protein n=1 Tax=Nakamurella panacisegetis TaxID=1090615 RepID=A0A1H0JNC6_9ACTN|nr:carbohydrate ABC transporter permease [Nakamurella panacisegetis]SDO45114.1 multiple sugar transport system permease protein [Nakamurella panacisegetis]